MATAASGDVQKVDASSSREIAIEKAPQEKVKDDDQEAANLKEQEDAAAAAKVVWYSVDAIPKDWQQAIGREMGKTYFVKMCMKITKEEETQVIYPVPRDRFSFMELPLAQIKVVIIGQDPYHGPNQAHGLCFSVQKGIALPPSLKNIYKELKSDLGNEGFPTIPDHGYLLSWLEQGVLLLNATLTVRKATPNSHAKYGWQDFTDAIISHLNRNSDKLVFMLWGGFAQKKGSKLSSSKHLILKAAHPSPLGANKGGWFGSKHFSKANSFLEKNGKEAIDWYRL